MNAFNNFTDFSESQRFKVQESWAKIKLDRGLYSERFFGLLITRPDIYVFFQSPGLYLIEGNIKNHAKLIVKVLDNIVLSLLDNVDFERLFFEVCVPHGELHITLEQFMYASDCLVQAAIEYFTSSEQLEAWKTFCTLLVTAMFDYCSAKRNERYNRYNQYKRKTIVTERVFKTIKKEHYTIDLRTCQIV